MHLTVDQMIAQLHAIHDEYGGDLSVLGVVDVPSAEYRLSDSGAEEIYAIRFQHE